MAAICYILFGLFILFQPSDINATHKCIHIDRWINAGIGDSPVIPCHPGSSSVSWRRGATSFCDIWFAGKIDQSEGRYSILQDGSLQIKSIEASPVFFCGSRDYGFYLCDIAFENHNHSLLTQVHSKDQRSIIAYLVISVFGLGILYLFWASVQVLYKAYKLREPFSFHGPTELSPEDPGCCKCRSSIFCNTCKKLHNWFESTPVKKKLKFTWFILVNIVLCFIDVCTDILQAIIHYQ